VILNDSGCFAIVPRAGLFANSLRGGDGNGAALSVARADVILRLQYFRQTKSR
jgi:hypothetical protein